MGFGLVLGEDGKRFRTRNTEVVRLVDLLDEAKSRSKTALVERGKLLGAHCMLCYRHGFFYFLVCMQASMR